MILRLGAVYIDKKMRVVERLLDVQIGGPGHVTYILQQLVDKYAIALYVVANDLDIDGGRQTEIEDLGNHIHGQGVERNSWKLVVELGAEVLHIDDLLDGASGSAPP